MLNGKPLFPGKNVVHQLDLMTDLLGTPAAESISRVSLSLFLLKPWQRLPNAGAELENLDCGGQKHKMYIMNMWLLGFEPKSP